MYCTYCTRASGEQLPIKRNEARDSRLGTAGAPAAANQRPQSASRWPSECPRAFLHQPLISPCLGCGPIRGPAARVQVQVLARAGGVREVSATGVRVWRYKRYKPGRTSSQGGRVQQVCGTCHQSSASYRIASNRIGSHRIAHRLRVSSFRWR